MELVTSCNKFIPQEKIDTIHEQVIRGDLKSVRRMLDKRGWVVARDHYGHTPLHKAVMANQESITKWLIERYPELIESRDNVSYDLINPHNCLVQKDV